MTTKGAAVLLLDITIADREGLMQGVQICQNFTLEKMLFAPSDEVAIVLCGTPGSANPLHTSTSGSRFGQLTVLHPLNVPVLSVLTPLHALEADVAAGPVPGAAPYDLLEPLILGVQMLHERTEGKKYSRVIYYITDARNEAARKEELEAVLTSLAADHISLVVVGVGFSDEAADLSGAVDMSTLDAKGQNERALHVVCATAGAGSLVVSPSEALEGLSTLRKRRVLQRPLLRVCLEVGDVHIAAQFFTKAQEEKMPTLKKVTADWAEVRVATADIVVGGPHAGEVVPPQDRVRGLRYGRSVIPCTEADTAAMKVRGPRALQALAFVAAAEVPAYVLTGGVRVLLPLAGDMAGQKGFACFVRAMQATQTMMVVRFVRTRDAAPKLGVLFPPSPDRPSRKSCLYFAPLPFAEDVRLFNFSEHEDVGCSTEEAALVATLVDEMTVGKEVLRPCETFNPTLHQYYGTLRAKALRAAATSEEEAQPPNPMTEGLDEVPPLLPALQASSTAFTAYGNPIAEVLRAAEDTLEGCATAFPFVAPARRTEAPRWFNLAAYGGDGDAGGRSTEGSTARAPSTVVAAMLARAGSADGTSSETSTIAAGFQAVDGRVTTADPVGSFHAMVAAGGPREQDRALAELADTIYELLRHSFKDMLYDKCDDCVHALRAFCVQEAMPEWFNSFLVRLGLIAEELGHGEGYWRGRIVASVSDSHRSAVLKRLGPITRAECADSDIADDSAAKQFLQKDRTLPEPEELPDIEDDLMDLIS